MIKAAQAFASSFLIAFPVLVTVKDHIGTPYGVNGRSMQPTLNPPLAASQRRRRFKFLQRGKDWVWVKTWRLKDLREDLQPGMVVAFWNPNDPFEMLVKRVVATSGEIVISKQNRQTFEDVEDIECTSVPRWHVWVEGDTERMSEDSNKFGPVSVSLVEGVVTRIVWPPSRWGRVPMELTSSQSARLISRHDDQRFFV